MTPNTEAIKKFITKNLQHLRFSSGGGGISHPEFELYARDYLVFAEKELATRDERSLINCVSYLKRAMDCQLDHFLYVCGLEKIFSKRNLKFDTKIEFLQACGISSTRTLSRLNTIRNRMEHAYEVPKITDLEIYFDLVVTFVSVLERTILIFSDSEREYEIIYDEDSFVEVPVPEVLADGDKSSTFTIAKYHFDLAYDTEVPKISVNWNTDEGEQSISVDTKDIHEFAYFFRIFMLLSFRDAFATDKYVLDQL